MHLRLGSGVSGLFVGSWYGFQMMVSSHLKREHPFFSNALAIRVDHPPSYLSVDTVARLCSWFTSSPQVLPLSWVNSKLICPFIPHSSMLLHICCLTCSFNWSSSSFIFNLLVPQSHSEIVSCQKPQINLIRLKSMSQGWFLLGVLEKKKNLFPCFCQILVTN